MKPKHSPTQFCRPQKVAEAELAEITSAALPKFDLKKPPDNWNNADHQGHNRKSGMQAFDLESKPYTWVEMKELDSSEQQYVKRAKAGDIEAFEYLYRSYNSRIYNFVAQIVTSEAEARDVVQDTFIKAWKSLPALRSDLAFQDWLYRIALNKAKDRLKSRRRLGEVGMDVQYDDGEVGECSFAGDSEDPEQSVQRKDLVDAVNRAIAELSTDHRAVIALHHIQGLEVQEVANILQVSCGTVMSRLARARAVLRRKLSSYVENQ